MNIVVVGAGYVGLSNAVLLSQRHQVTLIDVVQEKVDLIKRKISPIVDPEIQDFLSNKKLNLSVSCDGEDAYEKAEFVVIATPTNYSVETNEFDTSSVESVISDVHWANPNAWIVIKSTVGIGFTEKAIQKSGHERMVFSPEFLREGRALFDNLHPSRIVVGTVRKDELSCAAAKAFASCLLECSLKKDAPIYLLGATEAEAVKLFANSYLALRVAYFNELDTFAQKKNLDTKDIIQGVCSDPRIGDFYNNPSFGYGGYCLPKDTKELKANFAGIPESLISAIVESNETRKHFIANEIIKFGKSLNPGKETLTIGVFRLAMKSGSDNFRQSSIQDVAEILKRVGSFLIIYEPTLNTDEYKGIPVVNDEAVFKQRCDVIIANRLSSALSDVLEKVYTRDVFKRD